MVALLLALWLGSGLAACQDGLITALDQETVGGVQYSAMSTTVIHLGSPRVEVSLRARNVSPHRVRVEIGYNQPGCHHRLRAYASPEMKAPPAFDEGRLGYVVCRAYLQLIELMPGETKDYPAGGARHATILGDSLPEGTYYLSVAFRPNDGSPIELSAGPQALER